MVGGEEGSLYREYSVAQAQLDSANQALENQENLAAVKAVPGPSVGHGSANIGSDGFTGPVDDGMGPQLPADYVAPAPASSASVVTRDFSGVVSTVATGEALLRQAATITLNVSDDDSGGSSEDGDGAATSGLVDRSLDLTASNGGGRQLRLLILLYQ